MFYVSFPPIVWVEVQTGRITAVPALPRPQTSHCSSSLQVLEIVGLKACRAAGHSMNESRGIGMLADLVKNWYLLSLLHKRGEKGCPYQPVCSRSSVSLVAVPVGWYS